MGFDLKLVNIDGPTCMAEALARIEDGLKDVDDSIAHNEDEESPGLLRLLRDYLAGVEPAWETAGALEIAFELGKAAAGGKADAAALRERLLRGPKAAGEKKKREADEWRKPAYQLWLEHGATDRSISQSRLALIIQKTVKGADAVTERTVIETIRGWERESGT